MLHRNLLKFDKQTFFFLKVNANVQIGVEQVTIAEQVVY